MNTLFSLFFLIGCVHVHVPASSVQDMVHPMVVAPAPLTPWDGTNYALLDPLAVASSRAAEEAFRAQTIVLPAPSTTSSSGMGGQPSAPTLEDLQQDIRAIQRWIRAQENP
jgi:hypothetical protein